MYHIMSNIDTSGQFKEFYKKKGDYLVSLADNHFLNKEYKKTLELLNQAYSMYQKGSCTQEMEKIKLRFTEIKETHFKKS
jgi:hemerythrin